MTENKRYSLDFEECDAIWIDDNVKNKSYTIRNDTIKEKELEKIVDELNNLAEENEQLKQYKQAVNDVLDSYYQKDLSPIEEILVGGIARELNLDLHYKPKKGDA